MDRHRNTADIVHSDPDHTENVQDASVKQIAGRWVLIAHGSTVKLPATILKAGKVTIDKCDNVYFVVSGDYKYVVKINSRGKIILENWKKTNLSTVTDYKATNDDHDDISQKQQSKTTEYEDRKVSQSVAEVEDQRHDTHGDIPVVNPVHGKGEVASSTVNDDASNAICDTNQGETDVKTDCSAGLKLDSNLNINVQHMQTGKFTPSAGLDIGDTAETDDSIQLIEKLEIGESALRIPSNEENFKKEQQHADYNEDRKDTADAFPALDATENVQKVDRHSGGDFPASHSRDNNRLAGKTNVEKKLEDYVMSIDQARRSVTLKDDPLYKGTENEDIHGGARPKQREYNVQRNTDSSTQSKLDKGVEGQAMGRAESPTISSCGYGEELEQDVYDIQSPGQETISQYTDTATASLKSSVTLAVTLAVTFQISGDSEETEIKEIPLPLDKYMQYKYTLQSPTMLEMVNRQLKQNAQLLDRGLIIKTPLENLERLELFTNFVLNIIFEHSETLCFQTFNELENVNDCCIMLMESEFAKIHALYAETIGSEMLAVICPENIESKMFGILSKVLRKKKIEKTQTEHHQPQHSNQESQVNDQQPQTNSRQSQASNQEQQADRQHVQERKPQSQGNEQHPSAKIRLTQVGNQHSQPDSRPKLPGDQSQVSVDCQYIMQMDLIWQRLFQRFQISERIRADIGNINISTCMRSGQWDVTITGSQDNIALAKQMLNTWKQKLVHRKCNLRIKVMDIFFKTKICDIIEYELKGLELDCMVTLSENHDLLIYALTEETARKAQSCVSRMLIEVRIDIPGEWKEKVTPLIADAEGKYPNSVVISEVEHDVLCVTGLKDEAEEVADEIREILKEIENRQPVLVTRTVTFEHHEVFRHLKLSRFIADLSRKYNVDIKSITQGTHEGFEMKGQKDSVVKVENMLEEYAKQVKTETIECRTATGVSYFQSKDGQDFVSKMQDDGTVLIEDSSELEESGRSLDDGRMSEAGISMDKKADRVTWRFRNGHKLVLFMEDIGQSESQFVVTSIRSSQTGVGLKNRKRRKGTIQIHVDVKIPPWIDGKHGEIEATADVFYNVLTKAGEDNEDSVAFPLTSEQPEHLTNCLVAGIGIFFLSATENQQPTFAVIQAGDLEIFTKACGWCQTALSQLTSDECPPSGSRIRVKVEVGSLSETKADVLVNTAAASLNLKQGAISNALLQKAGPGLQSECRHKYPWALQRGEVAVTSGHGLSCKHVFHGALERYGRDEAQSITELREFINTCLTKASEMKMKTIAFPAIGTGNLGYPADIVASEMFGCMERFQQSVIVTSIQDVIFVVFGGDRNTVKIFQSFEKKFAPSAHVSQSKADTRSRAADRILFKITGIPKNTTKAKAILEDKIAALKKTVSTYSVELPQSLMSSLKQNGRALVDELKQDLHQYNVELVELPTYTELRSTTVARIREAGEHISKFCAQKKLIKDFKIPYSCKMDYVIEDVSKLEFELLSFFHKDMLRRYERYERDGINILHKKTDNTIVISGKLERVSVAQMEVQNILKDMMTSFFKEEIALDTVQANVDVEKVIEQVQTSQKYAYVDGFSKKNKIVIYGKLEYDVTKTKQLVLEGLNRGISGRQSAGDVLLADNSSDRKPTASYSTIEGKGKQAISDTSNPSLGEKPLGSNVSMGDNTRDRQPSQHKGQDSRTQQAENQIRTKPFSWKTDARNVKVFTTKEGIIIRVYEADILNLPVDCIVNMTSDRLNHFTGIACIIATAAGQQLISEGDEHVKMNGKLTIGEAMPTTAGKLHYRCVIHTVPPTWGSYSPYTADSVTRCEKDMYNAVQNSLVAADEIMVDSVALPGIGTVSFGVPIEIYAGQYAEAIIAYSRKMTSPSLKEIHVIDKDTQTIRAIQDTFDAMIVKRKANPRSIASYITRALPTPRHSGNAQGTSRVSEAGKEDKFVPMCYETGGKTRQQKQLVCRYGTHHELQIYSGDILHSNDIVAVVCSEDVSGSAIGMVAKLLLKNNPEYAHEKGEAFRRQKPRIGQVVTTKGGRLSYKWVLHALVPHIQSVKHDRKWQQQLQALIDTLFEKIATAKYKSVVMSLLGAGMSADPWHCAEVFYESYSAFCSKHPHLSCQVHLVNKDPTKTDVVKHLFQDRIDKIGKAQAAGGQSGSRSDDRTVAMAGATAMAPKQPGVSPSGSRSHDSRHSSQSHDSRHVGMTAATAMLPMQSGTSQSGSRSHDERNVSRSGSAAMVHGKQPSPSHRQTSPTYISSKQVVKGNQGDGNVKDTKDDSSDNCVICMDRMTNPKQLSCGHSFCTDCIDQHFTYKQACPTCGAVCGVITGDQPDGEMQVQYVRTSVTGYEQFGSIQITYLFPNGRQGPSHPNPSHPYKGISRTAYLPDNEEGQLIFAMLKVAFKRKVIFTIGSSRTTGKEDVITWNDIHHKTDHRPNTQFGYPDPTYLTRVKDELAAKGVTEADLKGSKTEKQRK